MQHASLISYFSVLLLLLFIQPLAAQNNRITRTVINSETNEPVPYATVSFPEQQYGFSTNASGQFQLQVNPTMLKRKVVISSIGFESFESTLGDLAKTKSDSISLHPKVTVLKEILVKAKAETPQDIIRRAEKKLKTFLRQNPYYLYAFYKEEIKKNNAYVGYTEAYGIFHISGYHPAYNRKNTLFSYDLAQWKNIRRSKYQISSECNDTVPRLLEVDKLIKAKSEYLYNGPFSKLRDQFRFTIDSLTSYNNEDVFIISFTPAQLEDISYRGNAYIKADDYALLKLEIWEESAERLFYSNCSIENVSAHFNLTYVKVGEKYYLNNIRLTSNYGSTPIEEHIEISGGEFRDSNVTKFNEEQRLIIYKEMTNPDIVYTSEFWAQHDRPIPSDVNDDLSTDAPLPRQFFTSSGKRIIPLPDTYSSYQEMFKDRDVFRIFLNADY
ncbi:carboxypeptidase-like regulatory domain-containing protein [Fulvivirga sp. 29W222]|uniref:Carboxypeptidase-like regulatory domain-containing protein n=1 Tax=Fulvivirga marina TaxID=2494733 RepID=A0A937KDQ7_9BACT|nr:carboxypeptidase-like regulatory domain-containing protein [Fulvivirga marina]MBL6448714.1 carboxypeptidase-like regulatory domain-containing protein [Fulvivirga marina]